MGGKYILLTEAKMLMVLCLHGGRILGAVLRDQLPVIILVGDCSYVPQSRHGDREGVVLLLLSQTLRFAGFEHAPPHPSHAHSSGTQSECPTQNTARMQ